MARAPPQLVCQITNCAWYLKEEYVDHVSSVRYSLQEGGFGRIDIIEVCRVVCRDNKGCIIILLRGAIVNRTKYC